MSKTKPWGCCNCHLLLLGSTIRFQAGDGPANLIWILSHTSDTCEVALSWRAISNPPSSCPSEKFAHHNENYLQTWKKREWLGSRTISVLLSYCPLMSFFPSGFAFRFFGGCGRAAVSHQFLQEQCSLAHLRCTAAIYRDPCFFAWLPSS